MLIVEMMSTGDEVLHGQIVDTNAAWLADVFFQQGLPLSTRTTVGDELDTLISTLLERSLYADVLIVNGGLGPTSDDLSAQAAAAAAGVELVEHPEWIAHMESYFADRGRPMSVSNRKQAMLPSCAELVDNPVGTACGFSLVINDCLMFFTPGVPSEFKVMVNDQILPRLRQLYALPQPPLCLRLTTFGRTESGLAQQFDSLPLPEGCVMGYRSSAPIIELKLTGPAKQQEAMEAAWQQVKQGVASNILFEGTDGLPASVVRKLTEKGLTLAVSESFSAGLLSWGLTSVEAPLRGAEVVPKGEETSTLETFLARAKRVAEQYGAEIGLAVGEYQEGTLSVALCTPTNSIALRLRYMPRNHSVRVQQDVAVALALDTLSRWLRGRADFGQHYEWLEEQDIIIR